MGRGADTILATGAGGQENQQNPPYGRGSGTAGPARVQWPLSGPRGPQPNRTPVAGPGPRKEAPMLIILPVAAIGYSLIYLLLGGGAGGAVLIFIIAKMLGK